METLVITTDSDWQLVHPICLQKFFAVISGFAHVVSHREAG